MYLLHRSHFQSSKISSPPTPIGPLDVHSWSRMATLNGKIIATSENLGIIAFSSDSPLYASRAREIIEREHTGTEIQMLVSRENQPLDWSTPSLMSAHL